MRFNSCWRSIAGPVLVAVLLSGCGDGGGSAVSGAVTATAPVTSTVPGPPSSGLSEEPSSPAQGTTLSPEPVSVAVPVSITVPAIGVQAEIVPVGLRPDGQMQTPDFGLAAWYTEGPRPGAPGPAVVIAHVDSYQGPDVFYRLADLAAGDEVTIARADGTTGTWVVDSSEQTDKDALPTERIWNTTSEPVLRLITCGGDFDRSIRSYTDNVVVYATPRR